MEPIHSLETVELRMAWESERALQPMGELPRNIRDILSKLVIADLKSNASTKSLVISLNKPTWVRLTREIHNLLFNRLKVDVATFNERISMVISFNAKEIQPLETSEVWERMENLVYLPEVPTGALPKPSIAQVLGAGRQQIFVVLMFLSIFARIGIDPELFRGFVTEESIILPSLSALFTLGVLTFGLVAGVNMYFSTQEELKAGWEVELSRVRLFLETEAIKVAEATEKVKKNCFRDYIRFLSKTQLRKPGTEIPENRTTTLSSRSSDPIRGKEADSPGFERAMKEPMNEVKQLSPTSKANPVAAEKISMSELAKNKRERENRK